MFSLVCFTGEMVQAWMKNSRTEYIKLLNRIKTKKSSGSGQVILTSLQSWRLASFAFLKAHRRIKEETEQMGMGGAALVPSETGSSDSEGSTHSQMSSTASLTHASSQLALDGYGIDNRPGTSGHTKFFVPPGVPLSKPKSKKRPRASKDEDSGEVDTHMNLLTKVLYDNTNTMADTISDLKEDHSSVRVSFLNYLKNEVQDFTDDQFKRFKKECNTAIQKFADERDMATSGVSTFQHSAQTTPHDTYSAYSFVQDISSAPHPPPFRQYHPQFHNPQYNPMFNNPPNPQRHRFHLADVPIPASPSMTPLATPARPYRPPNPMENINLNTPNLQYTSTETTTAATTTTQSGQPLVDLRNLVMTTIGNDTAEGNVSDEAVDVTNSGHHSDA